MSQPGNQNGRGEGCHFGKFRGCSKPTVYELNGSRFCKRHYAILKSIVADSKAQGRHPVHRERTGQAA